MKGAWVKIGCILLLCVAMLGCRPRGILSNKEMRDVLYDLHRVDGAVQVAGYSYGHTQEVAAYYKSVLDKHGVTQAQFDSSLVWFTDNPQIFNKIYPKVIDRLQMDMDYEEVLRDERMAVLREKRKQKLQGGEEIEELQTPLRSLEEVLKEYIYGIENPWKEWKNEDFCEKDVVIFGQLEKKL